MDYIFLVFSSCCLFKAAVSTECALIKGYNQYLDDTLQPSYVQLPGTYDVDENFSISFDLLINPLNSNGLIFSIGSKLNFSHDDLLDRDLRYFTIGIRHASWLEFTMKDSHITTAAFRRIPMNNDWNIVDGQWHQVKLSGDKSVFIGDGDWNLELDGSSHSSLSLARYNSVKQNIFIGGRPGYTKTQFQGIIKDIRVNLNRISLQGAETSGLAEFSDCKSQSSTLFKRRIRAENEICSRYMTEN